MALRTTARKRCLGVQARLIGRFCLFPLSGTKTLNFFPPRVAHSQMLGAPRHML